MLFSHIGILDEHFDYQPDMFVGTQGASIAYVGAEEPSPGLAAAFGERYDGRGKLLMPAFVNAHAHAPMVLLRGYAENLRLQQWLNDAVFPFEDHLTDDDVHAGTLVAIAEMARFGCVSCSDMYFCDDARCEAVRASGAKCNVSRGVTAFGEEDFSQTNDAKAYETLWNWNGAAGGRIKVDMCLHAEYTNNEHTYRQVADAAREHGAIVHVHVSETRAEHEECQQRHHGLTPTGLLLETGVLDSPVLAAHCVWCTPDDLDILAAHGTSIACNPASNMKLASGFAPVGAMLERGINVAIGTDGVASNNAHDMLRDTYLFATIYKGAALDPTLVTPPQALFAATRAGALAQGREDCGLVREGMRADLTVLDVDTPWMCPATDMAANVVYSASGSDVVLTMCDGRVLYRDGAWPTIDVEAAMAKTRAATQRIRTALGR
ncbi:MAG: amidohydrolase [Coriobacteriia bacterium]|nr:amidohydrolase [Coriobacteriia bacterium]MBS5477362.1 amidohydrolase [Coriobacteriia bacterium]